MTDWTVEWVNGRRCIVLADGRVLPVVAGGADEQEEGTEEPGQEGGDEGEEEGEGEEGGDEGREEEEIRDPAKRLAAIEEANARLSKKLRAGDKEKRELAEKLQKYEDEKKTEDQKLIERAEGAERRIQELEAEVHTLRVERMVLSHEKLSKLPPYRREVILAKLAPDLEIDEDGDSNLDELVAQAEKNDVALFRPPDDEDSEEEGKPAGTRPVKPPKRGQGPDQAALRKRFPAIARGRPT